MASTLSFNPPSVVCKANRELGVDIARLVGPGYPLGRSATATEISYTISNLEATLNDSEAEGFKPAAFRLLIDPETLNSELPVPVEVFVRAMKQELSDTEALRLSERLEAQNSYLEGLNQTILKRKDSWEIDFFWLFDTVMEIGVLNPDISRSAPAAGLDFQNDVHEDLISRYPAAEILINMMCLHRSATAAVRRIFGPVCDLFEFGGEDEDRIFTKNLTVAQSTVLLNLIGVKHFLNSLHLHLLGAFGQSVNTCDNIESKVETGLKCKL